MRGLLPGALVLLVPTTAATAEPSPAINTGIIEAMTPDANHVGVYSYAAVSIAIPTPHVTVAPRLGAEWSPELGAWGFVTSVAADVPVHPRLGVDFIATLVHDQVGADWGSAAFYAGPGVGVSLILGRWALSPSVTAVRALSSSNWTLGAGLNLAFSP